MNKSPKVKRSHESLTLLWATGLAITLFVTSVFQSWSKYADILKQDVVYFIFSMLLAIFSFGLFIMYAIATHHELNLLKDYLGEEDIPRVMPKTYLVIIGLSVLFGILIAVSDKLIIYSSIMVCYNLFDLWGGWQVSKQIGPSIDKKLASNQNKAYKQSLQTIKQFYFTMPTLPRVVTIMFINWIVVCLSLTYLLTSNELFRNTGYIILLMNIAFGEVIIHRWRVKSIYKLI